jgi:hypothetical protein
MKVWFLKQRFGREISVVTRLRLVDLGISVALLILSETDVREQGGINNRILLDGIDWAWGDLSPSQRSA